MKALLQVEGVVAGHGAVEVLHGVSLAVNEGEIVTLIGANGAGKTTLLRTISGLIRPTAGQIRWDGADIVGLGPDRIVRSGLLQCPEGRMVLGRMTVRDNLLLGAFTRADAAGVAQDLAWVLGMFPRLDERCNQMAGTLSGGEQQMLAIARSLMGKPRLLMLDEPSLGVAPLVVETLFAAIAEIQRKGVTVLLVEQNAARAMQAADRVYVLELGQVIRSGSSAELLNDERVRQAYLGT